MKKHRWSAATRQKTAAALSYTARVTQHQLEDLRERVNMVDPSRRNFLLQAGSLVASSLFISAAGACSALATNIKATGSRVGDKKVVVLGSGVTGLVAGALLAKLGYQVDVLEANPSLLGGHTRCFDINGLRFCAGPQYVWDFHTGGIGNRVLKYLEVEDKVPFLTMDPDGFERLIIGDGQPFDVPMGLDRFRAKMIRTYPGESEGLNKFFDFVVDLAECCNVIFDEGLYLKNGDAMALGTMLSTKLSFSIKERLLRARYWSLKDLFDKCNLSSSARRVLYGHGGIFADNEDKVSAIIYSGATGYYHSSAMYPTRGFDSLIDVICASIRDHGGTVSNGKTVTILKSKSSRVRSVRCQDGSEYECDEVVSTLSPRLTCALIPGCQPRKYSYAPSNALLACFVGTDLPAATNILARRNVWWQLGPDPVDYDNPDMTAPPQMLYVGSPTINHSYGNANISSRHALMLFAPGNYFQAKSAFSKGLQEHDALRKVIQERVLESADRYVLPGLRQHVDFVKVHTPLDIQHEVLAERGSVYGRKLSVTSLQRGITEGLVPGNVHIACATVGIPGVATCFKTAALLVNRLAGLEL